MMNLSPTEVFDFIEVMSNKRRFVLSYSTENTVQDYPRLRTLIMHEQVIMTWKW